MHTTAGASNENNNIVSCPTAMKLGIKSDTLERHPSATTKQKEAILVSMLSSPHDEAHPHSNLVKKRQT